MIITEDYSPFGILPPEFELQELLIAYDLASKNEDVAENWSLTSVLDVWVGISYWKLYEVRTDGVR